MKITESTLIPISLVITLLGGVGFFTYLAFQTQANAKSIEDLRNGAAILEAIKTDIAVIKLKVEIIEKRTSRR